MSSSAEVGSSGVVRCHHGVSSLAAMATRSLDVTAITTDADGVGRTSDFRLSRFAEGDLLRSPHLRVGAGQMR